MAEYRTAEEVVQIATAGGVVAIVRLDDLTRAIALARALLEGGVSALEFTLTNPEALQAIAEVKEALPDFDEGRAVIGAGTVLSAGAAHASVQAGAQFIVAPSTNLSTIEMCKSLGVAVMPGALTPTEIVAAWEAGANLVKVFPARAFGPAYFKDLREPLPHLRLMPTGGINLENASEFIRHGAVAVGVGGNLVDKNLIAAGDWKGLRDKAAAYVRAVREAREKLKADY